MAGSETAIAGAQITFSDAEIKAAGRDLSTRRHEKYLLDAVTKTKQPLSICSQIGGRRCFIVDDPSAFARLGEIERQGDREHVIVGSIDRCFFEIDDRRRVRFYETTLVHCLRIFHRLRSEFRYVSNLRDDGRFTPVPKPNMAANCSITHALLPGWGYAPGEIRAEMIPDLEALAERGERPVEATR